MEQSAIFVHFTATLNELVFGKVKKLTEGSLNPKVKMYDCPVIETSFEVSTILNEPFEFFVIVAKFAGAVVAPVEVNVFVVVLAQIPGVTTHAGMVSSVVSEMK